ncbi:MAG: hypothetical protein ACYC5M_00710 [Anaerolineae bacterium]
MSNDRVLMPGKAYIILLAVACGVLLGSALVGWTFPVDSRDDARPWQMQPEYQQHYLNLLATEYWHDPDPVRLQRTVEGWDRDGLAASLEVMLVQAADEEERLRLSALARAVAVEALPLSLGTLFQETPITASTLLAGTVFSAAIAVGASPHRHRPFPFRHDGLRPKRQEAAPGPLTEEDSRTSTEVPHEDAKGAHAAIEDSSETAAPTEEAQTSSDATGAPDIKAADPVRAGPINASHAGSRSGAPAVDAEATKAAEVSGLLASVFEGSDDPSADLAVLLRGLRDVSATDLAARCAQVSAQLAAGKKPPRGDTPNTQPQAV